MSKPSCPEPPKLSPEKRGGVAAELAKSMGIQSCDTKDFAANLTGELDAMVVKASMQASMNASSSIGCEPLIISADSFYQAQQSVSCVLKNSSSSSSLQVKPVNTINIIAGRDNNISCPNFKINQSINIKMVSLSDLKSQDKTEIAKAVKTAIDKTTKNITEQKMGVGAHGEGAKDVKDALTQIQNTDYSKLVSDVINEIKVEVGGENTVNITAVRDINLRGDQCVFDQNIVLDIVATAIVQQVAEAAFATVSEAVYKNDEERVQKYDAKGFEDFMKEARKPMLESSMKYIIIGIVAIVLICVIFAGIKLMGKKDVSGGTKSNMSSSAMSSSAMSSS